MSRDSFHAISWLKNENSSVPQSQLPIETDARALSLGELFSPSYSQPMVPDAFEALNTPESNPTSTPSPDLLQLSELATVVAQDVGHQMRNFSQFPASLKQSIYEEFLEHLYDNQLHQGLDLLQLDDPESFEAHFHQFDSPFFGVIHNFVSLFCQQVACIYLLRLRLIVQISRQRNMKVLAKDLLNPSSTLGAYLRRGGPGDIPSEALHANHFTWYRPAQSLVPILNASLGPLETCELSLLAPLVLASTQIAQSHPSSDGESTLEEMPDLYQERAFGHYLQTFLTTFPRWVREEETQAQTQTPLHQQLQLPAHHHFVAQSLRGGARLPEGLPTPIQCRYVGDHLTSLLTGFWSALKLHDQTKEIYRPVLGDASDSETNAYLRQVNELLYLSLLCQLAAVHKQEPCLFMQQLFKLQAQKPTGTRQFSIFPEAEMTALDRFDRIVLHLQHFPRNNPHVYLFNKILAQEKLLTTQGQILVFSHKKLFVPSLNSKIDGLLSKLKLEGSISLDHLTNIGNLPPYLYIFSRKNGRPSSSVHLNGGKNSNAFYSLMASHAAPLGRASAAGHQPGSKIKRHPCLSLRFAGNLSTFGDFAQIPKGLEDFFASKSCAQTSLYQQELTPQISFEFFQDAIIDGRLINSSSKDAGHITHPAFFRHLMGSSLTLDYFFHIKQIRPEEYDELLSPGLTVLGLNLQASKFDHVLVVSYRNPDQTLLEIIPLASLRAKSEEYGVAQSFYFGLVAKQSNLNINLFREYFSCSIGQQIVQLILAQDNPSKVKGKVSSLLLPKFFSIPTEIPQPQLGHVALLTSSAEKLLTLHPDQIREQFAQFQLFFEQQSRRYPWHLLGLLSFFNNSLTKLFTLFEEGATQRGFINYQNPLLSEALTRLPNLPIYPHNNDYYIEFMVSSSSELHWPLVHVEIGQDQDGEVAHHFVALYSADEIVVKIYSDPQACHLLQFILQQAFDIPIIDLLYNLRLPTVNSLHSIIKDYRDLQGFVTSCHIQTQKYIDQIFREQIQN